MPTRLLRLPPCSRTGPNGTGPRVAPRVTRRRLRVAGSLHRCGKNLRRIDDLLGANELPTLVEHEFFRSEEGTPDPNNPATYFNAPNVLPTLDTNPIHHSLRRDLAFLGDTNLTSDNQV